MKKVSQFLRNSYDKQIDGTGLAIFRITYCLVLLCEIAQMFYFRHLIFDKIPYIETAEINFAIPIGIWFIAVVFILFGAFTRFFSILNYIMGLILISTINSYEYHVFYAYLGVNFLLIFLPISQCFSIDRLFLKLKYSNTTFQYNPTKNVSQLYYFLPLFVAIGLVYFDSVFLKIMAKSWQHGLGMWMPSSEPMMVHFNLSFLLNSHYLMLFLGYLTLAFEALFIFLFYKKRYRILLFIIGVTFHIGILVTFPIPWFALTLCSLYLLLIPVSFWKKICTSKDTKKTLAFYYDAECPLCIRTKMSITHLDWFNKIEFKTVQFDAPENASLAGIDKDTLLDDIHSVDLKGTVYSGIDTYIQVFKRIFYLYPLSLILRLPGIYYLAKKTYSFIATNRTTERCTEENCGYNPPEIPNASKVKILQNFTLNDLKFTFLKVIIVYFTISQLLIIYTSQFMKNGKTIIHFENTFVDNAITKVSQINTKFTKIFFGLTAHYVFIDNIHYVGYNHIIAAVYKTKDNKEVWLPIIDKNGQPSYYNYGTNWRKMSFSTNNPNIDSKQLNSGIRDFTAFWAAKNGVDLTNATFLIKVKKIDSPSGWEKDFLNKQIAKPWIDGGFIQWDHNTFSSQIKDIEQL